MNDGYRPHASYITKTLIFTFIGGVMVGIAIGWGAKSSRNTHEPERTAGIAREHEATPPPTPNAATQSTVAPIPAQEVVTPESTPANPRPATDPAAGEAPAGVAPASGAPFEADVAGLWPAEHLVVGISGTKADVATLELLNEFKPGGIVLGPENVVDSLQLSALVLQIKKAVGLGTTIADPPVILYADDRAPLPRVMDGVPQDTASLTRQQLVEAATRHARAARDHGIGAIVAPFFDVTMAHLSSFPGSPTDAGDNPAQVSAWGLTVAGCLRGAGVLPVAAVFPGADLAVNDSDSRIYIPAGDMDKLAAAMQPFKAAIDAGLPGLLVGHMAVPGIDTERPNRPAALSPRLLQMLVRDEWGFTGVLLADDVIGHPMTRDMPRDEAVLKALVSGCDAIILRNPTRMDMRVVCEKFVELSTRDDFPMESIEASKQRLREWRDILDQPAPLVTTAMSTPEAVVSDVETAAPPADSRNNDAAAGGAAKTDATTPDTSAEGEAAAVPAPAPEETKPALEPDPEAATPTAEATGEASPDAAPDTAVTVEEPVPAPPVEETDAEIEAPEAPNSKVITHIIDKGETLTQIAKRYGVSTRNIRKWNSLENDVIKYGLKLKIHLPVATETQEPAGAAVPEEEVKPAEPAAPADAVEPAEPGTPDAAAETDGPGEAVEPTDPTSQTESTEAAEMTEPTEPTGTTESTTPDAPADPAEPADTAANEVPAPSSGPAPGTFELYEVSVGDNLRRIAQRFGTTQERLIEWNNIEHPDHVQIGWKLKVPKRAPAVTAPEGDALETPAAE